MFRPYILQRDPLCTIGTLCGGTAPSTDVDHVIRVEIYIEQHGGDITTFFDERNARGACKADHSRKTALEQRGLWREPGRDITAISRHPLSEGDGGSHL